MPGFSFYYNKRSSLSNSSKFPREILNKLLHFENYFKEDLFLQNNLSISSTRYPEYPVQKREVGRHTFLIEGKFYNKLIDTLVKEIAKIFESSSDEIKIKQNLKNYFQHIDGDYVLVIISDAKKVYVFNDFLARLPIYIYTDNSSVIISREARFILNLQNEIKYNKIGLGECLLFGYPLGEKTFFTGIRRIKPATLISIDLNTGNVDESILSDYNFEEKSNINLDEADLIDNLINLFNAAVTNRTSGENPNILSLSGGLDSRAILSSLHQQNINFTASTYKGYNPVSENDSRVAEQIAQKLNISWNLVEIDSPNGEEINKMIKIKNGLNTLSSAFLLNYFSKLRFQFSGGINFLTGDGGDKVFPDHRPGKNLSSIDELIEFTISNKYFFQPTQISRLLNIHKDDLLESLYNEFSFYPENSFNYKFVSFMIRERGIKWLFEAEDRNRFYFWTVTPFYSQPFFNFAMSISDDLKAGHKLYLKFLERLNPEIANFENALWSVPFDDNSFMYKIFKFASEDIYPKLPAGIKRKLRMKLNKLPEIELYNNTTESIILNSLFENETINGYFSYDHFKRIKSLNKTEYYHLLTLTMMMDDFSGESNVINKYLDTPFI